MNISKKLCLFVFFVIFITNIQAQNIEIRNPSFEGPRGRGVVPMEWMNAGRYLFLGFDAGDVLHFRDSIKTALDHVKMKATDGENYLALTVRKGKTWEMTSQKLASPLKKGQCYHLSLDLAHSRRMIKKELLYEKSPTPYYGYTYNQKNPGDPKVLNDVIFNAPTILKIWGSNSIDHRVELLAKSSPVSAERWTSFEFVLNPYANYSHIVLEAYYADGYYNTYGNILIDNLSLLEVVDCKMDSSMSFESAKQELGVFGETFIESLKLLARKDKEVKFPNHFYAFLNLLNTEPNWELEIGFRLKNAGIRNDLRLLMEEVMMKNAIPPNRFDFVKGRGRAKRWDFKNEIIALRLNKKKEKQ